jgi:acyl-CoA reductase-like NAD-dependent aldehyde dehydrogenase
MSDRPHQAGNYIDGRWADGESQEILRAARRLRFGGAHVNEASPSRIGLMPFGGVKCPGHGKEGPRYAAREMTEERLITISY